MQPSPVVSLNRAVAVAVAAGPRRGLEMINAMPQINELQNYHLLYAARADLVRRLRLRAEAAANYRRALE